MRKPQNAKLSENIVIPRRAKPDVGISCYFGDCAPRAFPRFAQGTTPVCALVRNDTSIDYSPMDCMTLFRAVFIGSVSGSLEEGSPLQSQS